ncbi:MAG: LysR family transcriptional regulator [Rhizobiaceae bacterium]|nr:LysR family transcriptional regulator [Rhizobiaceae bacterium]
MGPNMDIDRARTFLQIVHTGSFLKAAERLNVTQTTVSARIRTLEEELGRRLFVRNRNGAVLTAAGRDFERFAQSLMQVWERARQQLKVPQGRTAVVAMGGEFSLWNPLLVDWLVWMRDRQPGIAVRANVGMQDQLIEQLRTGVLDVAVLYSPPLLSGFRVELIVEEELLLVRTPPRADDDRPGYIHVDWGPHFAAMSGIGPAEFGDAGPAVGFGPLGLSYMLRVGGAGYFRKSAVKPHLGSGELQCVPDAPRFSYPAYALFADATEMRAELRAALDGLRSVSV